MGETEHLRAEALIEALPRGRSTVLEIGARHGDFSRLLADYFETVTALDLVKPAFQIDHVIPVEGNVTTLDFPDDSFDSVVCTEVLEHVPRCDQAAREMARVAKFDVVISVPYQQDTRYGRTTCAACGKQNPPWGHINIFDERRLKTMFDSLTPISTTLIGSTRDRTNSLSSWLMDLAGNPWGTYAQDEPCVHCGATLVPPASQSFLQRSGGFLAVQLRRCQIAFMRPSPNWIQMVFAKRPWPSLAQSP